MNKKLTNLMLVGITLGFTILICGCTANLQAEKSGSKHEGIIYRNPRVYNVEYSFEMFPDPNKIDRSKDLKLWLPIPREWDSQKAVKIISVEPEPHAKYVDPEFGNPLLFWDFGKEPEKPSYNINLKYRLEQYEVHSNVDPNRIGPYDKTSKNYILYTQSTNTISITDKVKKLANIVVGDEKNPYLQAKRIFEFVRKKMYYNGMGYLRRKRGTSIKGILDSAVVDEKTGEEYYFGDCIDLSTFVAALCRSVGIPARNVFGWWDRQDIEFTTIRIERGSEPATTRIERDGESPFESLDLSANVLSLSSESRVLGVHGWAEIYLLGYGWIPVDPTYDGFGHSYNNKVVIISKGCDIQIQPHALHKENKYYGGPFFPLQEGRAHWLLGGVWCMANMQRLKIEKYHHPDPFPADALAEYAAKFYPETEAERNHVLYRKRTLRWIDQNTRGHTDKTQALAQAYRKEPKVRYDHEAFICHMLRKVVGDKKNTDIVETYTNLRVKSSEPVSTARFQKIAEDVHGQPLDWFFNQWLGYTELPQLQLDAITFSEDEKGWIVRGNLRQLNKSLFRLPVELVLETNKKAECKTLWLEDRNTEFEFSTANKPKNVLIDPNNNILSIRKMPPLLENTSYHEVASCIITDQDKADRIGWTPLHFAAQAGRKDIVEYLIAKGADVNAENRQAGAPLNNAAYKGHKEVAELLIAKGADVNAKKSDYTPLYSAVWNEDRDMIKLLVTNGADVNFVAEDDWPYLHYVASNNDRELVELLLAHGAKLNVKDKRGRTAFRIAVSSGHRDLVEFLASKGATAPELHLAAFLGDLDSVTSLVEEGMDVDTKDEFGWTPLYWAASTAQEEMAEFLIGKGARIDIRTNNNLTTLHQAARSGAVKLAELLISKGVDSNARDEDDSTPLHSAAAERGHKNIVELLIVHGARVKAKEKSGNTPLHVAAKAGHTDIVEVLLVNGADANTKNNRGRTALVMAKNNDHTEIVELLRKHGAKE